MRTGKLVPDGVLCASQNFDRCHGSRNFCLLETTLVFALQKLRFGEPVVCYALRVQLSPYRPNKYPVRDTYGYKDS